jgi:hypothetical protein
MKAVRNSKGQLVVGSLPFIGPVLAHRAGNTTQRLLGFWMLWHSFGGLKPLLAAGVISRAGVYTQRNEFRKVFNIDVDELWPEISAAVAKAAGR